VPVHEGVDDGLAQSFKGYLVNVVPVETPDLAADIQVPFEVRFSDQADQRNGASRSSCRTKAITLSEQADHPDQGT
ncbi:MAG: hypothetical protein Q7J84_05770, partial [Sulfuricaulis sp.]|nr:hypothetical protein [Sulfuricaulis sp.]